MFRTSPPGSAGFTLLEVLIAMAITAFVSAIAYTGLSTVIAGVESTREVSQRTYEVNRAWMIISRDMRHFVARPVRDEFGELEPALSGGPAARFPLSFTRSGWHNPRAQPRSHLQRVNYRVEDEALWRDSYPVLDRAGDTEPVSAKLLEGVEYMDLGFLESLELAQGGDSATLDTKQWPESWVEDNSDPDGGLLPPIALELRLQLTDWGSMGRVYELPPL